MAGLNLALNYLNLSSVLTSRVAVYFLINTYTAAVTTIVILNSIEDTCSNIKPSIISRFLLAIVVDDSTYSYYYSSSISRSLRISRLIEEIEVFL